MISYEMDLPLKEIKKNIFQYKNSQNTISYQQKISIKEKKLGKATLSLLRI